MRRAFQLRGDMLGLSMGDLAEATRERGRPHKTSGSVFQFKVTLQGIRPSIWRRIQVLESYSFWDLHVAIQDAIGWRDRHLHVFRIVDPTDGQRVEIGVPTEDLVVGQVRVLPGWSIRIADCFTDESSRAAYEYDFGDGWEHKIVLEGARPREVGVRYPVCLAGERACPPRTAVVFPATPIFSRRFGT